MGNSTKARKRNTSALMSSSDFDRFEDFLEEADMSDGSSLTSTSLAALGARFPPTSKAFGIDVLKHLKSQSQVLLSGPTQFATHTETLSSTSGRPQLVSQSKMKANQFRRAMGNDPLHREDSGSVGDCEDDPPENIVSHGMVRYGI